MSDGLPSRERTFLLLAGAVVALGVVFLVLFLPKIQDVRAARREVQRKQEERLRLATFVQVRAQIEVQHAAARLALEGLRARVPAAPDLPGLIAGLDLAIETSGVQLLRLSFGKAEGSAESQGNQAAVSANVGTLTLQLQVRGNYLQLRSLVGAVESMSRVVSVDRLTMTADRGGIMADFSMRAFFFR